MIGLIQPMTGLGSYSQAASGISSDNRNALGQGGPINLGPDVEADPLLTIIDALPGIRANNASATPDPSPAQGYTRTGALQMRQYPQVSFFA